MSRTPGGTGTLLPKGPSFTFGPIPNFFFAFFESSGSVKEASFLTRFLADFWSFVEDEFSELSFFRPFFLVSVSSASSSVSVY